MKDQSADHVKRIAEYALDAIDAANETLIDLEDPERGYVQIRVGFNSGPGTSVLETSFQVWLTVRGSNPIFPRTPPLQCYPMSLVRKIPTTHCLATRSTLLLEWSQTRNLVVFIVLRSRPGCFTSKLRAFRSLAGEISKSKARAR